MLDISVNLLKRLNDSKIRYVHWKGNNHFEDGFNGIGDIDLLVHIDDIEQLHNILDSLNFINPYTQKYLQRSFFEDWIGMDSTTGKLLHLHIHFKAIFGSSLLNEYTFVHYEKCFDKYIVRENCKLQEPSMELIIFICRVYCGAVTSKEKIKNNLDYLKKNVTQNSFYDACQRCGLDRNQAEILWEAVSENFVDFHRAKTIIESLVKLNIKNKKAALLKRKIQYKVCRKLSKKSIRFFVKKNLKQKGVLIAFIGQDGAGKTTVTSDIVKWFRFKLEAKSFYLGSGDNYFSLQKKLLKSLPQKKNGILKIIAAALSVSNLRKNAVYTYKSIKKAEKYAKNGGIALFDRFPQTEYYGINDGPKIRECIIKKTGNKLLKKILLPFAVSEEKYIKKAEKIYPDAVIKLMLSPEESMRRKPHEKYEAVKQKHEIIKKIEYKNSQVFNVDVTQKYEDEIIQIKNILWNVITGNIKENMNQIF